MVVACPQKYGHRLLLVNTSPLYSSPFALLGFLRNFDCTGTRTVCMSTVQYLYYAVPIEGLIAAAVGHARQPPVACSTTQQWMSADHRRRMPFFLQHRRTLAFVLPHILENFLHKILSHPLGEACLSFLKLRESRGHAPTVLRASGIGSDLGASVDVPKAPDWSTGTSSRYSTCTSTGQQVSYLVTDHIATASYPYQGFDRT